MQQLVEEVTTASGRVITVTTVRQDKETVAAFVARHNEVVSALQGLDQASAGK